jgi:dCTP deaminase
LLEYTTLLFDLYPSNTSEIGFASQNTPYIPSPKGRGLYGAFSVNCTVVDPKNFDERSFVTMGPDVCIVPPNSFALARSVEYFKIPRDVLTICVGKSTYARCGIIVNVTPFEPEWEGFVTLEISNTTPLPARIYANQGLCQILFFQSDEVCETSYADRKGKYQSQKGIVLPKL